MSERPEGRSPFDRRNGLIAGGWLRVLKPVDQSVWMVYENHADRDGLSFPNTATVAELIGHANDKKVKEAVRRLVTFGLFEVLVPAAGGKSPRVRVLVPPPVTGNPYESHTPNRGADTPNRGASNTPRIGASTPQIGVPPHPKSGCEDTPNRGVAHKDEQTSEQTTEQISQAEPAATGGGELFPTTGAAKPTPADPAARSKPKSDRGPNPNHQPLKNHFFAQYEQALKCKPAWDGREAKAANELLAKCGQSLAVAMATVDRYFAQRDSFAAKRGYPLHWLVDEFPAYRPDAKPAGSTHHGNGRGPKINGFQDDPILPANCEEAERFNRSIRPGEARRRDAGAPQGRAGGAAPLHPHAKAS